MSTKRAFKKQAEWQRKRKDLPLAKKVRMVEAVRTSMEQLSRLKKRTSR